MHVVTGRSPQPPAGQACWLSPNCSQVEFTWPSVWLSSSSFFPGPCSTSRHLRWKCMRWTVGEFVVVVVFTGCWCLHLWVTGQFRGKKVGMNKNHWAGKTTEENRVKLNRKATTTKKAKFVVCCKCLLCFTLQNVSVSCLPAMPCQGQVSFQSSRQ